mgnify:CR=1 FL=1
MRYLIILFLIFSSVSLCFADRVCLEKSTGKLIEYQSSATEGTLIKNAINDGYQEVDIEEKEITKEEWKDLKEEQIDKPVKEEKEKQKEKRRQKESELQLKLGLTDEDFESLKEILK